MGDHTKSPGRKSARVKAWLYAVVNPWIDILEFENRFLATRGVSFRQHNRNLEHLTPIRQHLAPGAELIMDDLERWRPEVADWEKSHDAAIDRVARLAAEAFDAILNNVAIEVPLLVSQFTPGLKDFDDDPELFKKFMTQYLVNNVSPDLPREYTGHAFWNSNSVHSLLLKHRQGPAIEALDEASAELVRLNERAKQNLVDLRWGLVDEFDIPPAPLG